MEQSFANYVDWVQQSLAAAWERMVRQLFRPFAPVRWLLLSLLAWLATLGEHGGGNLNVPTEWLKKGAGNSSRLLQTEVAQAMSWTRQHLVLVVTVTAVLLLFLVALGVFLGWVKAHARFLFLRVVVEERREVLSGWDEMAPQANSLFLWALGFGVLMLALVLGWLTPVGWMIWVFIRDQKSAVPGMWWVWGALCVAGFILTVCLAALFQSLVVQFVIPAMAMGKTRLLPALRRVLSLVRRHWLGVLLYYVALVVMNSLAGMAALLLLLCTCCCCCLMLVPILSGMLWTLLFLPWLVLIRLFGFLFWQRLESASLPGPVPVPPLFLRPEPSHPASAGVP